MPAAAEMLERVYPFITIPQKPFDRYMNIKNLKKQYEVCVLIKVFDKTLNEAIDEVEKEGVKHYIGFFEDEKEVYEYLKNKKSMLPGLKDIHKLSSVFDYIDWFRVSFNLKKIWYVK